MLLSKKCSYSVLSFSLAFPFPSLLQKLPPRGPILSRAFSLTRSSVQPQPSFRSPPPSYRLQPHPPQLSAAPLRPLSPFYQDGSSASIETVNACNGNKRTRKGGDFTLRELSYLPSLYRKGISQHTQIYVYIYTEKYCSIPSYYYGWRKALTGI